MHRATTTRPVCLRADTHVHILDLTGSSGGTYFYHPHLHGTTATHLTGGARSAHRGAPGQLPPEVQAPDEPHSRPDARRHAALDPSCDATRDDLHRHSDQKADEPLCTAGRRGGGRHADDGRFVQHAAHGGQIGSGGIWRPSKLRRLRPRRLVAMRCGLSVLSAANRSVPSLSMASCSPQSRWRRAPGTAHG